MAGYLGNPQASAALDPNNPLLAGGWTIAFTPQIFRIPDDFEIYHMVISGPAGSVMSVYLNTIFYSTTSRGDINEWDPNFPLYVTRGSTVFMYWNSSNTPAPQATVFCRQPRP
jgi:hypothetical protein